MLKQQLQQKLGLKINPLQIQFIKLLELPTYQLEQRIKEELESNPLLEEGRDEESYQDDSMDHTEDTQEEHVHEEDDFSLDDYTHDSEDDVPDYKL